MYDKSLIKGRTEFKVLVNQINSNYFVTIKIECDGNKLWGNNACENYRKFILNEIKDYGEELFQSITRLVFPENNANVKVIFL